MGHFVIQFVCPILCKQFIYIYIHLFVSYSTYDLCAIFGQVENAFLFLFECVCVCECSVIVITILLWTMFTYFRIVVSYILFTMPLVELHKLGWLFNHLIQLAITEAIWFNIKYYMISGGSQLRASTYFFLSVCLTHTYVCSLNQSYAYICINTFYNMIHYNITRSSIGGGK